MARAVHQAGARLETQVVASPHPHQEAPVLTLSAPQAYAAARGVQVAAVLDWVALRPRDFR